MVIAFDPAVPRVWRTPDALQFGVGRPRLVLEPVARWEEVLVAAIDDGVTPEVARVVAEQAGAPPGAAAALLARLRPVLAPPSAPRREAPLIVLDGDGPTASLLAGLLASGGAEVRSGLAWSDPVVDAAAAAVIVGSYVVEPARHARWLRRDIPHLPVVFGDEGPVVGPFAHPGAGPCLRCVDLRRTEEDPAWPAIASQLYTRPRPGETPIVGAATAALAATLVLGAVSGGGPDGVDASAHYDARNGRWSRRRWEAHPECGCQGLPGAEVRPVSPCAAPAAAPEPDPGREAAAR